MALLTEAQLRAKLIIDPPGELRFIGKLYKTKKKIWKKNPQNIVHNKEGSRKNGFVKETKK